MPNEKPTKGKQNRTKPQSQQGHTPPNSQVSMASTPKLNNLQPPHSEQGNEPDARQGAARGQDEQSAAKPYRRIDKLNIALTLIFTFVIVVFTGISTYYSSKQWEGLRQSLEDARETRYVENRAYLGVRDSKVFKAALNTERPGQAKLIGEKEELMPGDFAALEVTIANNGNTPANAIVSQAFIDLRDMVPDDLVYAGNPAQQLQSVTAYGKDATFSLHALYAKQLTAEDISSMKAFQKFLIIYGFVTYRDVFNVPRETKFCYFYSPEAFRMSACPTHNRIE